QIRTGDDYKQTENGLRRADWCLAARSAARMGRRFARRTTPEKRGVLRARANPTDVRRASQGTIRCPLLPLGRPHVPSMAGRAKNHGGIAKRFDAPPGG